MTRSYEFIDKVPEDLPGIARHKLGERLVSVVSRERERLVESGRLVNGGVEAAAIERRFDDPGVARIALRAASEQNLLNYDETDGIVYPPLPQRRIEKIRYM